MLNNYEGMSMEQLVAMLQQRDSELEAMKQQQAKEYESKGYLFKQRKLVLHVTREELADKIGISVNTLANWEIGRTVPEWHRIGTLFEAYQLTDEQKLEYINETIANAKQKQAINEANKEQQVEEAEEVIAKEEPKAVEVVNNKKPRKKLNIKPREAK